MDDPLAVALKFGFLAVLYLFLLWVSRSSLRDLARSQEAVVASEPVETPSGAAATRAAAGGRAARRGAAAAGGGGGAGP